MNKLYAYGWGGKYSIDMDHMMIYIELACDYENECEAVYNKFFIEDFKKNDEIELMNGLYERFNLPFYIAEFDETKNYCFLNDGCYVSFNLREITDSELLTEEEVIDNDY